jgi:hypothetical protein
MLLCQPAGLAGDPMQAVDMAVVHAHLHAGRMCTQALLSTNTSPKNASRCTGLNFGRTITALYSFGLTLGTIYR